MNKWIEATMNRVILIIISLVILMVWGGLSAYRMQRDYLPPINNPTLMVTVHAPYLQSAEIKTSVSEPIERAVHTVNGLETLETNSFNGGLLLSLYFPVNYNMDRAESDVSAALGRVSLPAGMQAPAITRVNSSSLPIMRLSLTSPERKVDDHTLRTSVQSQARAALLNLTGVSDVRVTGAARNGYVLSIRSADLAKHGLSIEAVKQSLAGTSLQGTAGLITNSQVSIPLQASGWDGDEQALLQLPIRGSEGQTVPLSAIADLSKSEVDVQTISRTDGAASVVMDVLKTPSANITALSDEVRSRLDRLPGIQSGDVKLSVLFDQGRQVQSSLYGLLKEGLLGCLLSMASVFLFFRNIRSTLLVALSLPICFLVTTGLLETMGISLNILTVSGLIAAMGRVIDDTIVVLDNMCRKANESPQGWSPGLVTAAVREMLPAISASTAATVAVYVPIALAGGMISSAFSGFAWSVVIALLTSLVVAVFVVPALYFAWQKGRAHNSAVSIEPVSERVLNWAFQRKKTIFSAFGALLLLAGVAAFALPVNFLPANRSWQINVQLEFPEQTALPQVDAAVKRMEQALKSDADVAAFSSVLGSSFTPQFDDVFDAGGGWIQSSGTANIVVSVKNGADTDAASARLQTQLAELANGAVCTVSNQNISGDDSQLKIDLTGADGGTLERSAQLLRNKLQQVNGLSVAGAADDKAGHSGFRLSLNRETLQRTGIPADKVYARIAEYLSEGTKMDVRTDKQEKIPVVIRTDLFAQRANSSAMKDPATQILALLGAETFKDKDGKDVPLEQLATLTGNTGPSVIRERDGNPFAQVTANVTTRDVEKVAGAVKKVIAQTALPSGVHYAINGITAQVSQMLLQMGIALSVSVLLVVLILSFVFRGWRAPLTVLVCIPLAYIGSVLGMLVFGAEWNLATLVGLLMLTGIVVTNGIVLADKIERNLAGGMAAREAIVTGTASRVRPVLMTALTTILTLLPLSVFGGNDAVISQSLGIVVVCGMISSTLISLLAVPILYEWMHGHDAVRLTPAKWSHKKTEKNQDLHRLT